MSQVFEEIVRPQVLPVQAGTFCLMFSQEVMKSCSPHFERIDVHYEVAGLKETYKCVLDGRLYDVHIKART